MSTEEPDNLDSSISFEDVELIDIDPADFVDPDDFLMARGYGR